ncbi:MAG: hypothetical protein ACE5GX_17615 [Thermoanaerobaculia bacterium]
MILRRARRVEFFGLLLVAFVAVPWRVAADPVIPCDGNLLASMAPDQKEALKNKYAQYVEVVYQDTRNKTKKAFDDLKARGFCDDKFLGLYTHIACRAYAHEEWRIQKRIESRTQDCRSILEHLSDPANWDELAACKDPSDSTRNFRLKGLDCRGESICDEIHTSVENSIHRAATPIQAMEMMPDCMANLYRDIYGGGVGDIDDILLPYTLPSTDPAFW